MRDEGIPWFSREYASRKQKNEKGCSVMKKKTMAELENVKGFFKGFAALLEVLVLTVVYYIFWRQGYEGEAFPDYYHKGKYVLAGVYAALTILLYRNADGFAFGNLRRAGLIIAQGISLLMVNFITYFQLCPRCLCNKQE